MTRRIPPTPTRCACTNPNVLTRDRGTSRLTQGCTGQHALVEVERFDGPLSPITVHDRRRSANGRRLPAGLRRELGRIEAVVDSDAVTTPDGLTFRGSVLSDYQTHRPSISRTDLCGEFTGDQRGVQPVGTSRFLPAMRITAALWAAALLAQAITAGLLLSVPGGRGIHNAVGLLVYLAGLALLFTAILVWRSDGGTPRFLGASALGLVLAVVQGGLGHVGMTVVHVPLGAVMLAASTVLLGQAWSRSPSAAGAPSSAGLRAHGVNR